MAVPHLGDKAFLFTGSDTDQALTVLHGGAVFTVDLGAVQQWAGPGDPPTTAKGLPQQPPGLTRFHPAMEATVTRLMSVLSG